MVLGRVIQKVPSGSINANKLIPSAKDLQFPYQERGKKIHKVRKPIDCTGSKGDKYRNESEAVRFIYVVCLDMRSVFLCYGDVELVSPLVSQLEMPRSFLVKRRTSDPLDINFESQTGKERLCDTSSLNQQKSSDSFSTKNWYIEYHPAVPQVIPSKGCTVGNHGNARPCYLCHHGNLIPSHNGCIKYTPIQVPPRYNGMCYCVLCQQRSSAPMACNCQSCLSVRFEQTAASVLGPSEKNVAINPGLCCGRMRCESIEHIKYEFCHCAQCMERMSRDTGLHNHVHPIQRHERPKIHIIQHHTKDQNNNESPNEESGNDSIANADNSDISNGHESPGVEAKTEENHKHYTSWTSNLRKRKLEEAEQVCINPKVIKTELPETPCENNNSLRTIREEEMNDIVKPSKEECDIEYTNKEQEDDMKDSKDKVCVIKSICHKNGFDLDNKKQISTEIGMDKNHSRQVSSPRGRGRKHYNTRPTTTKPHSFDTDFVVPETAEWKQEKEVYSEISKSRQRSKLNRLLANEHERRRVAQLNSAYQDLRQLIPGYQCDTKLPKIKILRYAINYIAHLDNILEVDSDK